MAKSGRLEASDRVTYLMAFVPYLIEQGATPVTQLAEHFGLESTQVEELVQLLAMSGIPGDNGFYQHQDLFDINWDLFEDQKIVELWQHVGVEAPPRFSAREAAALLAGLQYISGIVPERDRDIIDKLVLKIATGASAEPENLLVTPAAVPVDLDVIRTAVASEHSVTFEYQNATGDKALRSVDPLRLDLVGESWYLRGWCHDREALRTFRLDRISKLSVSKEKARTKLTVNDLSEELFEPKESDIRVRFSIEESALPLVSAYQPAIIKVLDDEVLEIEVLFSSLSSVPVFVSQIPGSIRVLSPAEAVAEVQRWTNQALASYTA